MATGTTNDFNYSRNDIINGALQKVGAIAREDVADAATLQNGIKALNGVIRALDLRNPNIWKIANDPLVTFLSANTWRYTSNANMLEVVSAVYRDAQGIDTPLEVIDANQYASIPDKYEAGTPECVYVPQRRDITSTTEFLIWPSPASVTTTSVVTGTDSTVYSCVKAHTSESATRPISGTRYAQYWTAAGTSPSAWATSTAYTSGEHIRFTAKTPLADFDLATDNADLPAGFGLYLIYRLANDWSDDYHLPLDERARLRQQMNDAYAEVFPYHLGQADSYHNRTRYF